MAYEHHSRARRVRARSTEPSFERAPLISVDRENKA